MSDTRKSPIGSLVAEASVGIKAVLNHPTDMVKLGVKGRNLVEWAARHDIEIPTTLYATLPVGRDGVLARVGDGELILECAMGDPLWERFNAALQVAGSGVYRMEQESATLILRGQQALEIFAQTCGVDLESEPVDRMVYTRVAGVSCGILPRDEGSQRVFRLWVEYSLAPYLWETLAGITAELVADGSATSAKR